MNDTLRSKTWKITAADKALKELLGKGDKLVFRAEGDTCGCTCISRKGQRRPIWENAYVCEFTKTTTLSKRPAATVTRISGAMLSPGHPPYLLDMALYEFGRDQCHLIGDIYETGEHPTTPLATRLTKMLRSRKGSLKTLDGAELRALDEDGPFGHATGQWHADG